MEFIITIKSVYFPPTSIYRGWNLLLPLLIRDVQPLEGPCPQLLDHLPVCGKPAHDGGSNRQPVPAARKLGVVDRPRLPSPVIIATLPVAHLARKKRFRRILTRKPKPRVAGAQVTCRRG